MTTLIGTGNNPSYPAGQEFDVPDTDQNFITPADRTLDGFERVALGLR